MLFMMRKAIPKVSVIVPVYNKSRYLHACISSILGQSLTPIEVIVVDDASTDGSAEIVEDFMKQDDRIMLLRSNRNHGPGPARNRGLREASGSYVQFTDADDVLPRGAIELLSSMAVQSDLPAVRGAMAVFTDDPARYRVEDQIQTIDRRCFDFRESRALWLPWGHTCYLFHRRFLLDRRLAYPALRNGEDPVFLLRVLLQARRLSTTAEVCYLYRVGQANERTTFRHVDDYLTHVEMIKSLYLRNFAEAWHQHCRDFYFGTASRYLKDVALTERDRAFALNRMQSIWPPETVTAASEGG
jgi:glycosyltransferase involved in cell wall biosynthesis